MANFAGRESISTTDGMLQSSSQVLEIEHFESKFDSFF